MSFICLVLFPDDDLWYLLFVYLRLKSVCVEDVITEVEDVERSRADIEEVFVNEIAGMDGFWRADVSIKETVEEEGSWRTEVLVEVKETMVLGWVSEGFNKVKDISEVGLEIQEDCESSIQVGSTTIAVLSMGTGEGFIFSWSEPDLKN